jgi:tripartite-type tricarboxylate transporter receptor subunit TctC
MKRLGKLMSLVGAALVAAGLSVPAFAADWPDRPITMVIMSKEGGGMDRASRLVGDAIADKLGLPMKYVNRPGASGEIALQSFLNAKDDGYTIFSGNIPTLMVMYGASKKDYEISDLSWLGAYLQDPAMLITHPGSGIGSAEAFVEAAKASPQRVGVANWASVQTLALLQLIDQLDLQVEVIPYSGFKKASTALLGGHIEAAIGNFSAVKKLGDQVVTLGIFAEEAPGGEDIALINSLDGVSVIPAASMRAVAVHESLKTAHPDRYAALNGALATVISDQAFIDSFSSIGAVPEQSVTWNEENADSFGDDILELIDAIGAAFKEQS